MPAGSSVDLLCSGGHCRPAGIPDDVIPDRVGILLVLPAHSGEDGIAVLGQGMRIDISLVPRRTVELDPAAEVRAVTRDHLSELPRPVRPLVLVVQIAGDHLSEGVEMLIGAAVGLGGAN